MIRWFFRVSIYYIRFLWSHLVMCITYPQFLKGKRNYFCCVDEIFCSDKGKYKKIENKYVEKNKNYWKKQEDYTVEDYFPVLYENQKKMVLEIFLSALTKDSVVADIGCAAGEWTVQIAPHVARVDGYEYSQAMVEHAKKKWSAIENVSFTQADALKLSLKEQYDGVMLLGVLLYMEEADDIGRILQNVFESMKPGAILVTKDTLNWENKDVVYLYNRKTGYKAAYWSEDIYYEQFRKVGFVQKQEITLEAKRTGRTRYISRGGIWMKQ